MLLPGSSIGRYLVKRKLAEAALRDSEARYRALVEHAPEIIIVVDLEQNRLVDVNDDGQAGFAMYDRDNHPRAQIVVEPSTKKYTCSKR